MAALGDWFENRLVDWIFRGVAAPTLPANLFIALYTAAPSDSASGTEVSSTGTNYARVAVPRATGSTGWSATDAAGSTAATSSGTTGETSNNAAITFPAPGATGWGVITHLTIMDAATGGNILFHGSLGTPKTVNANDSAPSFAIGQQKWQIDN